MYREDGGSGVGRYRRGGCGGVEGGVHTEWCTVPQKTPRWMRITTQHKQREGTERRKNREQKKCYFTPMQHAEEIQLPLKLHECSWKNLDVSLPGQGRPKHF